MVSLEYGELALYITHTLQSVLAGPNHISKVRTSVCRSSVDP